jgi:hypothetical protein
MAKDNGVQTCFVIAPIGSEGSDIRVRSDQVLKHIISPAAKECGYGTVLRADQISEPGLITSQVIQHVVEDPLVIADLTGWNPNVFYELSLRHALKKPVVQIIHATEKIPFDIAASRTIHVDHHDLDSVARAKEEIVRQIKAVENNPTEVDNPISAAIELQSLRQSGNPLEKSNAEILTMLTDIRSTLSDLREEPRRMRMHPGMIEELIMFMESINNVLDSESEDIPSREHWERLRSRMHRSERMIHHLCMDAGLPPEMFMHRMRERKLRAGINSSHGASKDA